MHEILDFDHDHLCPDKNQLQLVWVPKMKVKIRLSKRILRITCSFHNGLTIMVSCVCGTIHQVCQSSSRKQIQGENIEQGIH